MCRVKARTSAGNIRSTSHNVVLNPADYSTIQWKDNISVYIHSHLCDKRFYEGKLVPSGLSFLPASRRE